MAEQEEKPKAPNVGGHRHSHEAVKSLVDEIRRFWRNSPEGQKPRDDLLSLLQRKLQDLDQDMEARMRTPGGKNEEAENRAPTSFSCDKLASAAAGSMFGATIALALLLLVFLGFGAHWLVHWLFDDPGAGTIVVAVVLTEIFPGLAVIARATDLARWIKSRSEPIACELCLNWRGLLGGLLLVSVLILLATVAWLMIGGE